LDIQPIGYAYSYSHWYALTYGNRLANSHCQPNPDVNPNSQRDIRYANAKPNTIHSPNVDIYKHNDDYLDALRLCDRRHADTQPDIHLFTFVKSNIYIHPNCHGYDTCSPCANCHADINPCFFGMYSNS
jgi:hypothetical protein